MNRPDVANVFVQLIKNVKPKQEIEAMKKKLILSRSSSKLPVSQSQRNVILLETQIPEVEAYKKKRQLEETLNKLKLQLLETERKFQLLKELNRNTCE